MEFDTAFDKLKNLLQQVSGGYSVDQWLGYRRELREAVKKFKSGTDYFNSLSARTDISQDMIWDMEENNEAIDLLFILVNQGKEA